MHGPYMDAVLRWRNGDETRIVVADPPPPKIEQDGHYFGLAKGTALRHGPVTAVYEELRDDDK
jgi:hypothetical protein